MIGLVTPAIATAIAFPVAPARPEISIALFMLAVVIAAVAGGSGPVSSRGSSPRRSGPSWSRTRS